MTMFSLTEDSKGKSLAIFYADGDSETIPETHVSFNAIIEKLISGTATDEDVRDLTRVLETVARKMSSLSERVSVDGTNVYFDGDPLAGELSEVIKSLFAEGSTNFKPLVNFLEKCKQNPSQQSVDDLYRWIKKGDLVIDPDGDIVAYKGVGKDANGVSQSIHRGTAFVDGVEFTGNIPNAPGTVVSMPRSEVDPNQMVGCSTGLHAGTYDYAMQYLGWNRETRLILVKINPRDVVSVPTDEQDRKMRVSRYTVLSDIDVASRLESSIYQPTLPEPDETEEDYFEEDDYDYEDDFLEDDEDEECDSDCSCWDDLEDEEEDEKEEEPAPSLADSLRDALGRFTPAAGRLMQRDSKGRFIS